MDIVKKGEEDESPMTLAVMKSFTQNSKYPLVD